MAKLKPEDALLNAQMSQRVRELRSALNESQSGFAAEKILDRQTLHRWENPKQQGPSIHSVRKFCDLIGISLKDFFDSDLFNDRLPS